MKKSLEKDMTQLLIDVDNYVDNSAYTKTKQYEKGLNKIPSWLIKKIKSLDDLPERATTRLTYDLATYKQIKASGIVFLMISVFAIYALVFKNTFLLDINKAQTIGIITLIGIAISYGIIVLFYLSSRNHFIKNLAYAYISGLDIQKEENIFELSETAWKELEEVQNGFNADYDIYQAQVKNEYNNLEKREIELSKKLTQVKATRTILSHDDMDELSGLIYSKFLMPYEPITRINQLELYSDNIKNETSLVLNFIADLTKEYIGNTPIKTTTVKVKIDNSLKEPVYSVAKDGIYFLNPEITLSSDDFMTYFYHKLIHNNINPLFDEAIKEFIKNNVN